jgi:hypothetical protein
MPTEDVWSEIRGWWVSGPKQTDDRFPKKADCSVLEGRKTEAFPWKEETSGTATPHISSISHKYIHTYIHTYASSRRPPSYTAASSIRIRIVFVVPCTRICICIFLGGVFLPWLLGCGTRRLFAGLKSKKSNIRHFLHLTRLTTRLQLHYTYPSRSQVSRQHLESR